MDHAQLDDSGVVIDGAFNGIAMAKELIKELNTGKVDEEDASEHHSALST